MCEMTVEIKNGTRFIYWHIRILYPFEYSDRILFEYIRCMIITLVSTIRQDSFRGLRNTQKLSLDPE